MLCLVSNYPNYLSPPINKMLEGQIRSLDVGPHIATHGVTPGCSDSDLLGQHPSLFPEFSHFEFLLCERKVQTGGRSVSKVFVLQV